MSELGQILSVIQRSFLDNNFEVTVHFLEEMRNDHLYFVDVQLAMLEAHSTVEVGADFCGNPKYEIVGKATDGREIGVVCSLRKTDNLLLITVYEIREIGEVRT